ncbi:hypothetical protein F511_16756 [Dorcoceras hygrometricum]|uniref:Uncharacterized protein n=1 Tax=Dorcoceras hygrometricum TaxID=472368 RepID=A0A2Z7AMJ6_9LAMI|nr:hypothetical protein F511_16756 [Dorcoceras hygrometricum]
MGGSAWRIASNKPKYVKEFLGSESTALTPAQIAELVATTVAQILASQHAPQPPPNLDQQAEEIRRMREELEARQAEEMRRMREELENQRAEEMRRMYEELENLRKEKSSAPPPPPAREILLHTIYILVLLSYTADLSIGGASSDTSPAPFDKCSLLAGIPTCSPIPDARRSRGPRRGSSSSADLFGYINWRRLWERRRRYKMPPKRTRTQRSGENSNTESTAPGSESTALTPAQIAELVATTVAQILASQHAPQPPPNLDQQAEEIRRMREELEARQAEEMRRMREELENQRAEEMRRIL